MVSLDDLIPVDHVYRKFVALWNFRSTEKAFKSLENDNNYKGYGLLRLFKCLLLQFMEDLSDRELERYLQENNAGKWFCGFGLTEITPNYSVFTRVREKIGTKQLSKLFIEMRNQLKAQGYMNEAFSFVDSSQLIAKASLWKERDKAIAEKYEKLNNEVLPEVAHDHRARIGCKGKDKYWNGYKRHLSVGMQSGLINKVAITAANMTDDAKGLNYICPSQGAIYADKAYSGKGAKITALKKSCHLAAIKKNNMRDKNKEQDSWYAKLRAPYERVFSKVSKRARYRGIAKNQFAGFMQAIVFNLKRLVVLNPSNLQLT